MNLAGSACKAISVKLILEETIGWSSPNAICNYM